MGKEADAERGTSGVASQWASGRASGLLSSGLALEARAPEPSQTRLRAKGRLREGRPFLPFPRRCFLSFGEGCCRPGLGGRVSPVSHRSPSVLSVDRAVCYSDE